MSLLSFISRGFRRAPEPAQYVPTDATQSAPRSNMELPTTCHTVYIEGEPKKDSTVTKSFVLFNSKDQVKDCTPPTVPIPEGYYLLREGDKRPPGYKHYCQGTWQRGFENLVGRPLSAADVEAAPFIAPLPTEAKTPAAGYSEVRTVYLTGPTPELHAKNAGSAWGQPGRLVTVPEGVTITRFVEKLLKDPSDAELERLFALEFTGQQFSVGPLSSADLWELTGGGWLPKNMFPAAPKYCSQFELVLPFLAKGGWQSNGGPKGVRVMIHNSPGNEYLVSTGYATYKSTSTPLARAAVIALLESKGYTIEISFDKI